MKEFNQLCKEFENLDALSYAAVLTQKSAAVLPALAAVTDDGIDGVTIFSAYIFASVAADGRVTEEEYVACYPLIHAFFGDAVTYDDCRDAARAVKLSRDEIDLAAQPMLDIFGLLPEGIQNDIILICLMICAVDGKVSHREKNWIKKLAAQ